MQNYYGNNGRGTKDCQVTTVVVGNSVDIDMSNEIICNSSEIRSDIVVEQFNAKRIWGQVLDCAGNPVSNSMIKLVRVNCINGKNHYEGIAHSITNCEGFYQFDICTDDLSCYKIIVNKATFGSEVIIDNQGGNYKLCKLNKDGRGDSNGQIYNPYCQSKGEISVQKMRCESKSTEYGTKFIPYYCGYCNQYNCPIQPSINNTGQYPKPYPVIIGNSAICR